MEPFLQMSALSPVFGIVESSSQHLIVRIHALAYESAGPPSGAADEAGAMTSGG
jgi:hypothetical protein